MVKKIRPVPRITKIEAEIDRVFGEVFSRKETFGLDESWVPCVDIFERKGEVIVEAELPGVGEHDISILLHCNRLEIKGRKKQNQPQDDVKYHRLEREYGRFHRYVFLPRAVVPERSRALLENGVLTVHLKKLSQRDERQVVVKVRRPERKRGGSHGKKKR